MPPSNDQLEAALVAEVQRLFKVNDLENLTVKRVRAAAEGSLDLAEGWFKEHKTWKERSKEVITSETELQYKTQASSQPDPSPKPKIHTKRKSPPSEDIAQLPTDSNSESEMSVVLDEAPRKRQKQSTEKNGKEAKKSKKIASKPKKASAEPKTENETKIKELQSQLVQCGIRKVWGVELKQFDTDKEKISHLQGMLRNAGMTGRFSAAKAKEIKEARELAQDLEAVQEGAKAWGADSDEEGKPRRRVAKGLAELDWLADQGSDSD